MENNVVEKRSGQMPLIGERAPEFVANTTHGRITFPDDYKGKWVILFSHPADFTPVCTTEFMTFASMYDEFQDLNTELIGLSIDSLHSHLAWTKSIESYEWNGHKGLSIKFPIIDDISMDVAHKYGMIHSGSATSTIRAVFIIDPEGVMRALLYYPSSMGRNFDEIKRMIVGLQKNDSDGVALPANWKPGDDVILPPPATSEGIDNRIDEAKGDGHHMLDWYLTFKEDK